jgi:hypothetical protein
MNDDIRTYEVAVGGAGETDGDSAPIKLPQASRHRQQRQVMTCHHKINYD